ncbi:hypothetical protein DFH27DRAFT_616722 [Peziza echinospora]|nr:hypothetical protein DFH27DRAFT_616722 [Peziza echinospora]
MRSIGPYKASTKVGRLLLVTTIDLVHASQFNGMNDAGVTHQWEGVHCGQQAGVSGLEPALPPSQFCSSTQPPSSASAQDLLPTTLPPLRALIIRPSYPSAHASFAKSHPHIRPLQHPFGNIPDAMDAKQERHARRAREQEERLERRRQQQEATLLHDRLSSIAGNLAHYFGYRRSGRMPGTRFTTKCQFCTHISSSPALLAAFADCAGATTLTDALALLAVLQGHSKQGDRAAYDDYSYRAHDCGLDVQDIVDVATHLATQGFTGTGAPFDKLERPSASALIRLLNNVLEVEDCTQPTEAEIQRLAGMWSDSVGNMGFDYHLKQLKTPRGHRAHEFMVQIKAWTDNKHWGFMRAIFKQVALEQHIKEYKAETERGTQESRASRLEELKDLERDLDWLKQKVDRLQGGDD